MRSSLLLLAVVASCRGRAASRDLDPQRDNLMRPEALLAWLRVPAGATVADAGAGAGYLALPLARAVGPSGKVIATDVNGDALATLRERARAAGLADRIETRVVAADDPGLAPASVDLVLLSHVDGFLPDRAAWLARLRPALRPGARLIVVNYATGRAALLAAAAEARYDLVDDAPALLPAQFAVQLVPRP